MVRGGEQLRGRQRQQLWNGELKKRQTSSSRLYFAVYGSDTGKQGDRRRPRHGGDTRTGRWPLSETQLQKIKRLAAICLAVPTSNTRLFCVAALFSATRPPTTTTTTAPLLLTHSVGTLKGTRLPRSHGAVDQLTWNDKVDEIVGGKMRRKRLQRGWLQRGFFCFFFILFFFLLLFFKAHSLMPRRRESI